MGLFDDFINWNKKLLASKEPGIIYQCSKDDDGSKEEHLYLFGIQFHTWNGPTKSLPSRPNVVEAIPVTHQTRQLEKKTTKFLS